jgi:hypothetical protein
MSTQHLTHNLVDAAEEQYRCEADCEYHCNHATIVRTQAVVGWVPENPVRQLVDTSSAAIDVVSQAMADLAGLARDVEARRLNDYEVAESIRAVRDALAALMGDAPMGADVGDHILAIPEVWARQFVAVRGGAR